VLLRRQALPAPRRLGPAAWWRPNPQDTGGKRITASFLYGVTRSLFEQAGFSYVRPKGKNHTVMRTTIDPAR